MPLWDALAGLRVTVDGYSLERAELQTASGWTRVTTTVVLAGAGETGRGEDVTYTAPDHDHVPADLPLEGERSLDEYSRHLDGLEIWRGDPANTTSRDHRRWAFESAALDLALRQAGRSLGEQLGRAYRPVRFVVSTRAEIEPWLELQPAMEFKLDVEADWDRPLMERLAALDRVRVLDLKAYYRGTSVDLAPDPAQYARRGGDLPRRRDRGPVARGRLPRGARRRGVAAELRRARPLARGSRRAAAASRSG